MKPRGSERDTTQKGQVTPPGGRRACWRADGKRATARAGKGGPGPGRGQVRGARAGSVGPSEVVAKAETDGEARLRPLASRLGSKSLGETGKPGRAELRRGGDGPRAQLSVFPRVPVCGGAGDGGAGESAPTAEISEALVPEREAGGRTGDTGDRST